LKLKHLIFGVCILFCLSINAQHELTIDATLIPTETSIEIQQTTRYVNTSEETLTEIYFNDWANSFSTKTTPLAKRFAENFKSNFHFERNQDRGRTTIEKITNSDQTALEYRRGEALDILIVTLNEPLVPGNSVEINSTYKVKMPDDKFTRFGVNKDGTYRLRYWYLSPAVYDGTWEAYSNKNTQDLFLTPSTFDITMHIPESYALTSGLELVSESTLNGINTIHLNGQNRNSADIYLNPFKEFESILTDKLEVITNIEAKKVSPAIRAVMVDRVVHFLDERLGDYPFDQIVASNADYKNSPVYGLNQLPSWISPFPDGFEYDLEQFKSITAKYLENVLSLHPRKDYWLYGAIQIYLMEEYVDTYYPNMKILGSLSNWWIIKWSHVSQLEFNDQYPLLYLNMARNNLQQSLSTPKDSLVKFNKNIANRYYGGSGLRYLADYIGNDTFEAVLKSFYSQNQLRPITSEVFREALEQESEKPVDWFFDEYVSKRSSIDFKIKAVKKFGDSLQVTIKNKRDVKAPVSIYGLNKKKEVVSKTWLPAIDSLATFTIPGADTRRLVLNYEGNITEFNRRNNTKNLKGILNRPLQFRLFQDAQDPRYNQLFFMPIFEFNLYDGFTTGMKLYNKTLLPKAIHYKLEPQFGYRSKKIIGNGSIQYTQLVDSESLYSMRYGFSGSYYSYDEDLLYRRYSPFITFAFRPSDLRDNEKQYINIRNINVIRDENINDPNQEPNYSVFNLQYVYSNPNLINYFRGFVDYQISSKFSKVAATVAYRKLFTNNHQLNLRLYVGAFLFNDTNPNEDFFSFALDRPTVYLFDYTYYGRSEDTGIFSQQLIVAEGGFKSQLSPAFANSWITTLNGSFNIWRWIYVYGDAGLVHNKGIGTQAVYDSGIRINLVQDYFELYFPMYSNLGFEPGLPNYNERIRFTITLSPKTLLGLFTRRWY